jgi:hypothetical protein
MKRSWMEGNGVKLSIHWVRKIFLPTLDISAMHRVKFVTPKPTRTDVHPIWVTHTHPYPPILKLGEWISNI